MMILTYIVGGIGLVIGTSTVTKTPADLTLACLLAVGGVGILSFIRHALLHRSDAARMGWDYGKRNNFQIEVGIANLAWGVVALLAVILNWGLTIEAGLFLVEGVYISSVALMTIVSPGGQRRDIGGIIATSAFGAVLLYVGILGMSAAT
ncbi:MAG: hypothetical protein F2561_02425 [Actinobacteria bacterium]|nr:hypothetical protein [Actinomycetota bacterium]